MYLQVYGSPTYIERLVGDKLESTSNLSRFVGYSKKVTGYYFYDQSRLKIFVSRNVIFLEKGFPMDSQCDEELLEDSCEIPHQDNATPSELVVSKNNAPVIRRSTRVSQPPDRYGFLGLTSQLDGDPTTYREAMYDINLDRWLAAMNPKWTQWFESCLDPRAPT